ncbi:MAG: hypothetical protein M1824_000491 [Vezdaea acicularis]|nr:MAG: hypothetical protein M1824_000491 [Vezdaea acicularis]
MIVRAARLQTLPSFLLPSIRTPSRHLHQHLSAGQIPAPTAFVPDPQTFLTLIGRNLKQHAAKIPSWEALFTLTSSQLRELGIEPARSRRYLLRWRDKFRRGKFGIGGDLQEVKDGVALLKVVGVPKKLDAATNVPVETGPFLPMMKKVILNVPADAEVSRMPLEHIQPVAGLKLSGRDFINGPHTESVKGSSGTLAKLAVKEGLWEDKRGRKIDGGERRRAEVRAKRRGEEKRTRRG